MARILNLNPPFQGLSSIVNVEGPVGPGQMNASNDVKVVQQLLQMCAKGSNVGIDFPQVTGRFDAATGFWIYQVQNTTGESVVDGVVSPAHGVHYGPQGIWTIVLFNHFANLHDPSSYKTFASSQT